MYSSVLLTETFRRNNFHVGQQTVISEIVSSVRNLMGAFMLPISARGILGREANVIYCRVYFFSITSSDQMSTEEEHFDILYLDKISLCG